MRTDKTCYSRPPMSEHTKHLLHLSATEVDGLTKRDVHCPVCGFTVDRVYQDATGHKDTKCHKCKFSGPINLAYFRRQKGIGRLRQKYYGER